jgi:DNA-binding CsgD family transcriptional regulator
MPADFTFSHFFHLQKIRMKTRLQRSIEKTLRICQLQADGKSNKEISCIVAVSVTSVERSIKTMRLRRGIHSNLHLIAVLMREGAIK